MKKTPQNAKNTKMKYNDFIVDRESKKEDLLYNGTIWLRGRKTGVGFSNLCLDHVLNVIAEFNRDRKITYNHYCELKSVHANKAKSLSSLLNWFPIQGDELQDRKSNQ